MSEELQSRPRKVHLPSLPPHPVHFLPKKPGQRGRTEVHCLEDVCIIVSKIFATYAREV